MNVVRLPPRSLGSARMVPSPAELRPDWKIAWPWLFWALWGVWLAASDLRSDDIQAAMLRLLVGGTVLGFARPKRWWLWSLALAVWVPAEPAVAALLHLTPATDYNSGVWLLPPVPALVGGYLGRSIANGVRTRRNA